MNGNQSNSFTEKKRIWSLQRNFVMAATCQARISYLLMSIHAVQPEFITSLIDADPHQYLFLNMIYGFSLMLYARPSMVPLSFIHRVAFSILGSLMFNHGSMLAFQWVKEVLKSKPSYAITCAGILTGRMMLLHLLAYLYHVDSRSRSVRIRGYSDFEDMYRD